MLGALLIVSFGLAVGYLLVVVCSLASTIGLASAAPRFVVRDHRLRGGYKLLHEAMWTVWSLGGGFAVAVVVGRGTLAWVAGAALATVLILLLWRNSWEARQRGLPHQILLTALTFAGVAGGVFLRVR